MEVLTVEKLIEEGKLLKELILPLLTKEDIQQAPITQQLQLEWEQIGKQIGQQRGEQIGRQKLMRTLARILTIQFGVELDHFADSLPKLSLEALEALCEVALTVPMLSDFEQALQGYLPPDESLAD